MTVHHPQSHDLGRACLPLKLESRIFSYLSREISKLLLKGDMDLFLFASKYFDKARSIQYVVSYHIMNLTVQVVQEALTIALLSSRIGRASCALEIINSFCTFNHCPSEVNDAPISDRVQYFKEVAALLKHYRGMHNLLAASQKWLAVVHRCA